MRIKTLRYCEKSAIMTAGSYKLGRFHIKRNVKEPHREVEEVKSVTNQEISGRHVETPGVATSTGFDKLHT